MTTKPCKNSYGYRGLFAPRCNCYPCWETFFRANPNKLYSAVLAAKNFGMKTVAKVQGDKYIKALKRFIKAEEEKGNKII